MSSLRVKSSQLGARCHGNLHPLLFQALTAAPSPPCLILGPIIHLCSLPILPDFPSLVGLPSCQEEIKETAVCLFSNTSPPLLTFASSFRLVCWRPLPFSLHLPCELTKHDLVTEKLAELGGQGVRPRRPGGKRKASRNKESQDAGNSQKRDVLF